MRQIIVAAGLLIVTAPVLAQGRRGPDRAPAVGTKAPDFELERLDPKTKSPTGKTVKLSEAHAKRPVALIFGSYT